MLLKCTHCAIHLSNAKYTWNAGVRLHYYLLHRQYLLGLLSFVAEDPLFHGWFVASSRPPHFHPQLNFLNYHWGLIFCDPVRNVKKLRIIALPCFRNDVILSYGKTKVTTPWTYRVRSVCLAYCLLWKHVSAKWSWSVLAQIGILW